MERNDPSCIHGYQEDPVPVICRQRGDEVTKSHLMPSLSMGGWHTHKHSCSKCGDSFWTSCWKAECLAPLIARLRRGELPEGPPIPSDRPAQVDASAQKAETDPIKAQVIEILQANGPLRTDDVWAKLGGDWGEIHHALHAMALRGFEGPPGRPRVVHREDFKYEFRTK